MTNNINRTRSRRRRRKSNKPVNRRRKIRISGGTPNTPFFNGIRNIAKIRWHLDHGNIIIYDEHQNPNLVELYKPSIKELGLEINNINNCLNLPDNSSLKNKIIHNMYETGYPFNTMSEYTDFFVIYYLYLVNNPNTT
jgi:hypothetical protein